MVLPMSLLHFTSENFEEQVIGATVPVLVDFFATWCGPCRMLSPVVEEIAEEHPEYLVGKVDVDEEVELAQRFGVMSIPTLIVFRNGDVSAKQIGYCDKEEILAMLEK